MTINNNKKPENLNKPVIIQKKMNLQTGNLYGDTMTPENFNVKCRSWRIASIIQETNAVNLT